MNSIREIEDKRDAVLNQIRSIRSMKRGSINEQYLRVKHKEEKEAAVKGPYYVFSRREGNRTVSERITSEVDARKAMKDYRHALEIDPEHVDAHVHIGNLLFHNHRPKPAEICYRKAVELGRKQLGEIQPGDGWGFIETRPFMRGLHGLGLSLGKQKRWQEALECYKELLRLNPGDNQGVRYIVGYVYHRMGDLENAEKWYRENDDRPDGAWNLVCLLFQQKRMREAIEALISAIPTNKHVPDVILNPSWGRSRSPYISFGGRDQAETYADFYRDLWLGDSGYYKFLREITSDSEIKTFIDQERPKMPSEIEIRRISKRLTEKLGNGK